MSVSTAELFELGELLINDGIDADFFIESFNFVPAQKKPTMIGNTDGDGEIPARESHYGNATIEWTIRVRYQGSTAATLAKLGELTDAHQAAEKVFGGQPITWTVHGTETPYTGYVQSADIVELPVTPVGDQAGWLIDAPVAKYKLTCGPFWTRPPRVAKASTESAAEPLQTLYVGGILGDEPAIARLRVTDKAGVDRRFAQWGRDVVTSEAGNPPLLLKASTDLVVAGFTGQVKTRAGAYGSEKVVRATAVSLPTTMFGTGRIAHVGSFAVYYRVFATSATARFRLTYRNGDGALMRLEWRSPAVVGAWSDLYLGEAFLDAVELGTQSSELRVDSIDGTVVSENDGNYLTLIPGKASGRARGIADDSPTSLAGLDRFEKKAVLSGSAPDLPSATTWVEIFSAGKSRFNETAGLFLERTAFSETNLISGDFALLGTVAYPSFVESITIKKGTRMPGPGQSMGGLLARYVNATNWIFAGLKNIEGALKLTVQACIGGELIPFIREADPTAFSGSEELHTDVNVTFAITAEGVWSVKAGEGANAAPEYENGGFDPVLAPGGTIATGRVGIYDVNVNAAAPARMYDTYQLFAPEPAGRACYSNRIVEFNSQGCERQDATGAYDGQPSMYRGGGLYLEPAGELGLINRLAVRMRRNDDDVEGDTVVTDKHAAEVLVEERFLHPR
jgi:hypothetical protein